MKNTNAFLPSLPSRDTPWNLWQKANPVRVFRGSNFSDINRAPRAPAKTIDQHPHLYKSGVVVVRLKTSREADEGSEGGKEQRCFVSFETIRGGVK